MKIKALKSENTFRFQSFSERLAAVNIDVIHKLGQHRETPEEGETFFGESLAKWRDLNCTASFENFRTDLAGVDFKSLAQLLHNKTVILECLQRHLQIPNGTAYNAFLELMVSLARDLLDAFYPHFGAFFEIISTLLGAKDSELLEQVFTSVSYLFKYLWRYMVKDIDNVYKLYSPLLEDSNREYIVDFATESISFLLRKVQNKVHLLDLIFDNLDDNSTNTKGVGKLLCEILQSVQRHFHSNASDLLYTILTKVGLALSVNRKSFTWQAVIDCLSHMMTGMMEYTTRALSTIIWDSFLRALNELKDTYVSAEVEAWPIVTDHMSRVLELLFVCVSYKECVIVQYDKRFQEVLLGILNLEVLPDDCGRPLMQIVASLLLSPHLKLEISAVKKFIDSVFCSKCSLELRLLFSQKMCKFGMFEKDVLPSLLRCCHDLLSRSDTEKEYVLQVLTSMVLRFRPLLPDGDGLRHWRRFSIEFSSPSCSPRVKHEHNRLFMEHLERLMKLQDSNDFVQTHIQQIPQMWCAVVCIPHTSRGHHSVLVTHMSDLIKNLVNMLKAKAMIGQQNTAFDGSLFLLAQTLESLQLVSQIGIVDENFSLEDATFLLTNYANNVHILRMMYSYLTYLQSHGRTEGSSPAFLAQVYPSLEANLASPYHQVRLLTLKILVGFQLELTKLEAGAEEESRQNVFEICLAAERLKTDLQEYRERIRLLTCLQVNIVRKSLPVDTMYHRAPLYYLIGTLYVNFRLFWEPTVKLIESHAREMNSETFWMVFGTFLRKAAEISEKTAVTPSEDAHSPLNTTTQSTRSFLVNGVISGTVDSIFFEQKEQMENMTERVDYGNHRQQLWKVLAGAADLAESRSDLLSDLLLGFIRREYCHVEIIGSHTEDLTRESTTSILEDDDDDDDDDDEDPDEEEEVEEAAEAVDDKMPASLGKRNQKGRIKPSVSATQSLCAHLSVFARFRSPQSVSRETELRELYLRLLQNPIPAVQRLALDCIVSYSHSHLSPYKDNLYRILTPKTFRSEITRFGIATENGAVLPEHRGHVIPLLMRILYGKMAGREPLNRKGGRDAFVAKRTVIFQFIASSGETEMVDFLNLAFAPYVGADDEQLLATVQRVMDNRDFTAVDPLNKMRGALLHLDIVFKNLGHRIRSVLPWLFRVLIVLTAKVAVLLEHRELIRSYLQDKLKQLRQTALELITQFFQRFDSYPFSREEIEATFVVAVWPQLPRMPTEVLSAPTLLLKMFLSWSHNPRYFILLAKHRKDDETMVPLRLIMELLSNEKVPNTVANVVLEVATNLLSLGDHRGTAVKAISQSGKVDGEEPMELEGEEDDAEEGNTIEVDDVIKVEKGKLDSGGDTLNYGTLILLPYVTHLMARLKQIVAKTAKTSGIPAKHLTVLTRLSEIVTDQNYCKELASLMLPFLNKTQNRTEESEVSILKVIVALVKLAANPKTFLSQLPVLFCTVVHRQSRVLLCELLSAVTAAQVEDKFLRDMIVKMNAYNVRRPEEPDYKRRLAAFQMASEIINRQDENPDKTLYLFLIYNCVFIINAVNDRSLRDSASNCLQCIVKKLGTIKDRQLVDALMIRTLLPEVSKGLKADAEELRNEYVTIMAECVRACPTLPVLKDLHPLLNDNPDIDFFESLRHVQIHRRAAGLKRLAEGGHCANINHQVLLHYILPQAQLVLYHERYGLEKTMVTAAVQLIGKICLHLPWAQYEKQLRFFIDRLSKSTPLHQSRSVKALSAVLDAFHFNLSNSKFSEDNLIAPSPNIKAERFNREAEGDKNEEGANLSAKNDRFPPLQEQEATRIHTTITKSILPLLHRHLSQKVQQYSQAVSDARPGDSELLRVPMTIAIVKLLQKLPKSQLDRNLPSVLLKICGFLKSRVEGTRITARNSLVSIMRSLGPEYLPYLVLEIGHVLIRGYQVHVKVFTIYTVMHALAGQLQPGDLDSCLPTLIAACQEELFGKLAEEKEVAELVNKCSESKSKQSFNIYEILARFSTEGQLNSLIYLLQERLKSTTDHEDVKKIEDCLSRIANGLSTNQSISYRNMLVFSYLVFSKAVTTLEEKQVKIEPVTTPSHLVRPDTYIIQKEPGRTKAIAPTYARTNAHVSAAFAANLLFLSMKAGRIKITEKEHLEMLDPFVPKLASSLSTPFSSLVLASVKCLNSLLRSHLPSIITHAQGIADSIFVLLKKYGQSGKKSNQITELVTRCFKTLTVLISQVPGYKLTTSDLRIVLVYVEQDMMDLNKHATAFTMLKAILSRKLILPEIRDIMTKVIELSVSCSTDHIRVQCRLCAFKYLTDYPLGMEVMTHLNFYMRQLEYSVESGRESALEMLTTVFDTFPPALITEHAAIFFVPLATRLINDKAERLRKMTSLALAIFLQRISVEEKNNMFMIAETWMKDANIMHRRLACMLFGIFADAEKKDFQGRVTQTLPLLVDQLVPTDPSKVQSQEDQHISDHIIIQALTALIKIISNCNVARDVRYLKICNTLWGRTYELLHHSHLWVQVRADQLIGMLLANYKPSEFPVILQKKVAVGKNPDYVLENFPHRFGQLFFKLAWQTTNAHQVADMEEQLLLNLLHIARILCRVPEDLLKVDKSKQDFRTTRAIDAAIEAEDVDDDSNLKAEAGSSSKTLTVSFGYLARTMKLHAEREGVKTRGITTRRTVYCNWVLKLVPDLPRELVIKHLTILLVPLVRELMSTTKDEALLNLTNSVVDRLRAIVGVAIFSEHYSAAQTQITKTRIKRKRDRAVMAVTEPQVLASQKIKSHLRKVANNKRKRADLIFQGNREGLKRKKAKRSSVA